MGLTPQELKTAATLTDMGLRKLMLKRRRQKRRKDMMRMGRYRRNGVPYHGGHQGIRFGGRQRTGHSGHWGYLDRFSRYNRKRGGHAKHGQPGGVRGALKFMEYKDKYGRAAVNRKRYGR